MDSIHLFVFAACLHSLCLPVKAAMTTTDKENMLDLHNMARQRVNPTASNMVPLTWSDSIASYAQSYSANCVWGHNPASQNLYGENIYAGTYPNPVEMACDGWEDEKSDYNYNTNGCSGVCGHYTQMVWAQSTTIGCGMTLCATLSGTSMRNAYFVVCNYSPPGNYIGQKPYIAGTPTTTISGNADGTITTSTSKTWSTWINSLASQLNVLPSYFQTLSSASTSITLRIYDNPTYTAVNTWIQIDALSRSTSSSAQALSITSVQSSALSSGSGSTGSTGTTRTSTGSTGTTMNPTTTGTTRTTTGSTGTTRTTTGSTGTTRTTSSTTSTTGGSVVLTTTGSDQESDGGGGGGGANTGAIVAGVIVPIVIIGLVVAGFIMYRRKQGDLGFAYSAKLWSQKDDSQAVGSGVPNSSSSSSSSILHYSQIPQTTNSYDPAPHLPPPASPSAPSPLVVPSNYRPLPVPTQKPLPALPPN